MAKLAKDAPVLSRMEWQAVAVALNDADRHPCGREAGTEGRLARALRWLTGAQAPRPLADPRLDAVRRFVCAVRGGGDRLRDLVPELKDFGYSPAQIEALRLVAG
ncbi:MAG TPA: hypothetical protein VGC10_11015 [Sphingomonas sp.]